MSDILRVFSKFKIGQSDLSVNLVEVSPYLSQVQEKRLCITNNSDSKEGDPKKDTNHNKQSTSFYGSPVRWYNHLADVPRAFTLYLAHEFFDALPVHKLVKTNQGWREVLIDINHEDSTLRYVLSRDRTPASLYCLVTIIASFTFTHIFSKFKNSTGEWNEERIGSEPSEFSYHPVNGSKNPSRRRFYLQLTIWSTIVKNVFSTGVGLVMDYGHEGDKTDTFRVCSKTKSCLRNSPFTGINLSITGFQEP